MKDYPFEQAQVRDIVARSGPVETDALFLWRRVAKIALGHKFQWEVNLVDGKPTLFIYGLTVGVVHGVTSVVYYTDLEDAIRERAMVYFSGDTEQDGKAIKPSAGVRGDTLLWACYERAIEDYTEELHKGKWQGTLSMSEATNRISISVFRQRAHE
jgi:hypothetical protein